MKTCRRVQCRAWTPAETAISEAMATIEKAGADVRLTDAVRLLDAALGAVADYVDGLPRRDPGTLFSHLRNDLLDREKGLEAADPFAAEDACMASGELSIDAWRVSHKGVVRYFEGDDAEARARFSDEARDGGEVRVMRFDTAPTKEPFAYAFRYTWDNGLKPTAWEFQKRPKQPRQAIEDQQSGIEVKALYTRPTTPADPRPDPRDEALRAAEKLSRTLDCAPRKMVAAFGTDATDGLDELCQALAKIDAVIQQAYCEGFGEALEARAVIAAMQPVGWRDMESEGADYDPANCQCSRCVNEAVKADGGTTFDPRLIRMFVCPLCGNKRCPHADFHGYRCTGSNDVGQVPEPLTAPPGVGS